jgi:hypothetical protein
MRVFRIYNDGRLPNGNELAVRVPSSLIPGEDNILLNPVHPRYEALQWDSRLLEMIGAVQST